MYILNGIQKKRKKDKKTKTELDFVKIRIERTKKFGWHCCCCHLTNNGQSKNQNENNRKHFPLFIHLLISQEIYLFNLFYVLFIRILLFLTKPFRSYSANVGQFRPISANRINYVDILLIKARYQMEHSSYFCWAYWEGVRERWSERETKWVVHKTTLRKEWKMMLCRSNKAFKWQPL